MNKNNLIIFKALNQIHFLILIFKALNQIHFLILIFKILKKIFYNFLKLNRLIKKFKMIMTKSNFRIHSLIIYKVKKQNKIIKKKILKIDYRIKSKIRTENYLNF